MTVNDMWSRPAVKLIVVVAMQVLILLSVIAFKQYTVWTGETVLLKTAPIDPRDPLRGDYVTVLYEISRLDSRELAGDAYVYGEAFVELREGDDGYWEAVAIHEERERAFDGTVLIKGAVKSQYFDGRATVYDIEYGIEDVFIEEGSGVDLPVGADADVGVEVKVDRFGNAVAREIVVRE